MNITNGSNLNSSIYDNINDVYFCKNNGGNMTAAQKVEEIVKNGGSGLWIVLGVGIGACLLISVGVCYCRSKDSDVKEEGGENESRTIFKA